MAAEAPDHWHIVPESESEEEEKEAEDLANWAGEATPRSSSKKLNSLFKIRVEAQRAGRVEELEQEDDHDHSIERSDGRVPQAYMKENIAQSIPPHLRQQFTLATVACICRFERDTDQQMVENVTKTMRELLRKPPRSQPASGPHEDKHLELTEDALCYSWNNRNKSTRF